MSSNLKSALAARSQLQKEPASGGARARRNWPTRGDVVSHPKSSAGKKGPLSALRSGRGGALAEQFGSVTRRFPWSVIAIEALSPMVFIHTCRIIIMPGHQYLLGFLAPLFESHRRLVSYVCVAAGFCSQSSGKRLCIILFRKRQVATF